MNLESPPDLDAVRASYNAVADNYDVHAPLGAIRRGALECFTSFLSDGGCVPLSDRKPSRGYAPARRPCSGRRQGKHHPFLTNSLEPAVAADVTHRRHAIIETVFSDLIAGPLAHLPSGRFAANGAWALCAAITHNLLEAAGTLASPAHAVARGATLRRDLITVPARLTRPQGRRVLHLPAHRPWADPWTALWDALFATGPPAAA